MPRSQANLKLTFLQGVRGRTIEAKVLYVALLLEPSLTPCGVGVYRLDWWAREAELKADDAERALTELEEQRYAFTDPDTGEVLVRTLIRRDGIADKPNMLWAACRAARLIRSEKLRRVVADELRKLPPQPAPTLGKNGKVYHHPDPHATADEIDPDGPRDPHREPISNGSRTYPEPFDFEPIPNHSRTTGGGGGGGGEGFSSVGGQVGRSRAHARETPTPHDPPCEKPCHVCREARLADETSAAELKAAERKRRAESIAARDACELCDEAGWVLGEDLKPVEPADRCDHRTLRIVAS